jgi:hypothetical protein
LLNEWTLDHPYGPEILNLHWRTKIFITEGRQPIEIAGIPEIEQGEFVRFLVFRVIDWLSMKNTLKNNGDKL